MFSQPTFFKRHSVSEILGAAIAALL